MKTTIGNLTVMDLSRELNRLADSHDEYVASKQAVATVWQRDYAEVLAPQLDVDVDKLMQLLTQTSEEHHVYEQARGTRDDFWADWYAARLWALLLTVTS